MNTGRFVASAVAVWILRVALNWTFYTKVIGARAHEQPRSLRLTLACFVRWCRRISSRTFCLRSPLPIFSLELERLLEEEQSRG